MALSNSNRKWLVITLNGSHGNFEVSAKDCMEYNRPFPALLICDMHIRCLRLIYELFCPVETQTQCFQNKSAKMSSGLSVLTWFWACIWSISCNALITIHKSSVTCVTSVLRLDPDHFHFACKERGRVRWTRCIYDAKILIFMFHVHLQQLFPLSLLLSGWNWINARIFAFLHRWVSATHMHKCLWHSTRKPWKHSLLFGNYM